MHNVPQTPSPVKAYFATFADVEGVAIRDANRAVWFVNAAQDVTLLHNCDMPALMLHGQADVALAQRVLDDQIGFAAIACSRQMEV
jgi:hypothetical protein